MRGPPFAASGLVQRKMARNGEPPSPRFSLIASRQRTAGCDREGVTPVSTFKNPALKQLTDQQVRFAPPARRQEQIARAEQLLEEIDLTKHYPNQFVCYRTTAYLPDS